MCALGVLTSLACSPEPALAPEITTGLAPTDQQPVALPDAMENPAFGLAAAGLWPPACQLITDAEITAVLPQATGLTRRSRDSLVHYSGTWSLVAPDGSVSAGHAIRDVQVPGTGCGIDAELPAVDPDDGDQDVWRAVSISVDVRAVGAPEVVTHGFDAAVDGLDGIPDHPATPDLYGAERCVDTYSNRSPDAVTSRIWCRRGRMSVEVEITVFGPPPRLAARLAGQPTNTDPAALVEHFDRQVVPQFFSVVFRRMS